MELTFLMPQALWLLLCLPVLFVVPRGARSLRAAGLRALVMTLVVLALAHPVTERVSTTEHHVLIVDSSASVEPSEALQLEQLARAWEAALPARAQAVLVELGGAPATALGAEVLPARVERVSLDSAQAPLAHALAVAAARIPDGTRGAVTLASDGLDGAGGWQRVAADLAARGIPLHCVELQTVAGTRPVGLRQLAPVRLGSTARLIAAIVGFAPLVDVVLRADGVEVARVEGLALDGRARVLLEFEPERAGFLPLSLEVSGERVNAETAVLASVLPVDDPLRALYVGPAERGADLAELRALIGPGVSMERAEAEYTERELEAVDLVFLEDRAAASLPDGFAAAVARAVSEEGLGLFAAGAHQAFGAGGWQDTALADVLPVEALQKEEKRDPSVALAIVIDTSGSMGGNRVQLAKETARLAMRRLLPHDKVGIVEFYGAKRWAAPIQPASNNIELERALNRLAAGGGTVILPAIEEAFYGLLNVDARYKHVLVLTDGGVESGAFEPLLRRMASRGITTSTVLIGGDAHSEFLVTLANWGKGRFYSVPNRFNLPEVLFKQPTSAKLSGVRPGEAPVRARGGPGWWGDMDPEAVPAVASLVETELRPGAERVLETIEGERPVLSSWRYGLGRVTAMPTEPLGPGTRPFGDWPDYGRFLARTLERTARDLVPFTFEVERSTELVRVTALRRTHAPLRPQSRLVSAAGEVMEPLRFEQRAPGRFEAELLADPGENLRFVGGVRETAARGARATRFVSCVVPDGNLDPRAALDLAELAAGTGGVFVASDEARTGVELTRALLATGGAGNAPALREWRPWLLALALAAYLFDVFDRRRARRVTTGTP